MSKDALGQHVERQNAQAAKDLQENPHVRSFLSCLSFGSSSDCITRYIRASVGECQSPEFEKCWESFRKTCMMRHH